MSARPNCAICDRDPKRMNSDVAECSHVECPYRRCAWSERPTSQERARALAKAPAEDVTPALDFDYETLQRLGLR